MNISKETCDKIEEAFNLIEVYILYIREKDRTTHFEANGSPPCDRSIKEARLALHEDKRADILSSGKAHDLGG